MAKQFLAAAMGLALAGCGSSTPAEVEPDDIITGVNYVGASVSDLDKAVKLYGDAVDLKSVDETPISENALFDDLADREGVTAETRMLRSVNAQIRFMKFANPSEDAQQTMPMDVQGPGIAHACYQVNRKTGAYQKFLAGGAKHIGDRELVQINPKNPVYYGYARDFDGLIAEIEEVDVERLDLPAPPPNQYRIRHISLATPDIDKMIAFYSAFLGGQEARHVGSWFPISSENADKVSGLAGSELEMAWFQVRNLELEIFQYHSHPTKPLSKSRPIDALGYNMIVFNVSDMKAARKRLVDAGGEIVAEPGLMDGGQIMFGRDPDGNLIGLQTVPADSVFSAKNFKDNGT